MLVLGGNGHKLNASLIDYETETETQLDLGAKVPMPVMGHLLSFVKFLFTTLVSTGKKGYVKFTQFKYNPRNLRKGYVNLKETT